MCQSIAEGGRRCDCLKGSEKRRARQKARYWAKKQNDHYAQSIHDDSGEEDFIDEDSLDTISQEIAEIDLDDVDEDLIDELSLEDKKALRQRAREELETFTQEKDKAYEGLVEKSLRQAFSTYHFADFLSAEQMIDQLSDEDKASDKLSMALSLKNMDPYVIGEEELAFEKSTRDCGNALRVAAMITAEEIIEEKGLTVENSEDDAYLKKLLETHPEGKDAPYISTREETLSHEKRISDYEKTHSGSNKVNVIKELDDGREVDPNDFVDFIYSALATKQKRKGSSKFYAFDNNIAQFLDDAYHSWEEETNDPDFSISDMASVTLDRKKAIKGIAFGKKSIDGDTVMIPRGQEIQKFVMKKLVDYYSDREADLTSIDKFCAHDIMNQELASVFGEAVKRESKNSFDGEKVSISRENKNVEDSDRRDFDFASTCFPDSLVESAGARNHKVSFMRDNGFMRGSTYVSKRAFFQRNGSYKESQDVKDAVFMFDYDFMGRRSAEKPRYDVTNIDEDLSKKIASNNRLYNLDFKDERYPPISNAELVKEMEDFVRDHNNGVTDTAVRSNENSSTSPLAQLRTKEFTDPRGVKRMAIVADVKRRQTFYTAEIHTNGTRDTTLHEMSHYMESDPQVWKACKAFLHRRTEGLEETVYYKSHKGKEMTVTDGFYNSYVGKDYKGRENTEVFSMGMEAVFCPDSIRRVEEKAITNGIIGYNRISHGQLQDFTPHHEDREHLNLILGIIGSHNGDVLKGKKRL